MERIIPALTLRSGTPRDLAFMLAMLLEAAFWRPGVVRPPPDAALARPELARLLRGWGRPGDAAVIAERPGRGPVGAAWYRLWTDTEHSYGYVAADVPELAIAVTAPERGRGIGGRLLTALRHRAAGQGIEWLSLSVERDNPARRLYERQGFERVRLVGNAWTMRARSRTATSV